LQGIEGIKKNLWKLKSSIDKSMLLFSFYFIPFAKLLHLNTHAIDKQLTHHYK